jgi:hypothetical protein
MTNHIEQDEALYTPSAFWLRPDRDDFDVPCWMIKDDYAPRKREVGVVHLYLGEGVQFEKCLVIDRLGNTKAISRII